MLARPLRRASYLLGRWLGLAIVVGIATDHCVRATGLGDVLAERMELLLDGIPYREIHDRTLVSVTTIGRVARTLERGAGGYDAAVRRLHRSSASR